LRATCGVMAPMRSVTQAETDAQVVLDEYWADENGRITLPIDPIAIAQKMGIEVYLAHLSPDVSGIIANEGTGLTTINLNVFEAPVRRRFTCAHEIGHFYLHHLEKTTEFGYIDERRMIAPAPGETTAKHEHYANRFAAALIMPADLMKRYAGFELAETARIFEVSLDALSIRRSTLAL
jgi:IrrE N-terminal-like domain